MDRYVPASHWLDRSIFTCMNIDSLISVLEARSTVTIYCYVHYNSNNNRLDHYLPILFAKWLQQVLHTIVIVQVSGDHIESAYNIIAASGIVPHRSFIFSESSQISRMYPLICKIQKATPLANLQPALNNHDQIYDYVAKITHAAPCFSAALPHILPKSAHCIHITDEIFESNCNDKMHGSKPTIFKYTHMPPLQGKHVEHGTHICITDSREKIAENIRKLAFSGGRDTLIDHKKYGADISVDISIIYLQMLMPNQELLTSITRDYQTGIITTSCVKDYLIGLLYEYLPISDKSQDDILAIMTSERRLQ